MKINIVRSARFIILVAVVVSAFCFADLLPYDIRSFSYGISLAIREVVLFVLPFVVFSIVFQSISRLQKASALEVVVALIAMIVLSNTASMTVAHFVGKFATLHMTEELQISEKKTEEVLEPFFSFSLPTHISCLKAVLLGFLCGLILPCVTKGRSIPVAEKMGRYCFLALEKTFTPILPIFVVGLVFRIQSERIVEVLQDNVEIGLYFFIAALLHIMLMYIVASGFSIRGALVKFRSMIPPALFAFASLSSLLSMPLVQRAVKGKMKNIDVVDVVLPVSLNMHLVGNCFLLLIVAQVVSILFPGGGLSTSGDYINFLLHLLLAGFAVVTVPGGGILVIVPIFEQYLHQKPEILVALYVVFEPILAFLNVLGNGAFMFSFCKVYDKILRKRSTGEGHKDDGPAAEVV